VAQEGDSPSRKLKQLLAAAVVAAVAGCFIDEEWILLFFSFVIICASMVSNANKPIYLGIERTSG
jgi:hypothetical protein